MPEDKNKKKQSSKDSKSLAREAISTSDKKKVQDYQDSLNLYNKFKNIVYNDADIKKYGKQAISEIGPNGYMSEKTHDEFGRKIKNYRKYDSGDRYDDKGNKINIYKDKIKPVGEYYYSDKKGEDPIVWRYKKPVQPYVLEKEKSTITPVKQKIKKEIIVGDKKDFDRINSQSPLIKESDGVYRNDLGQSFKFGKKQTQIITKKNENPEVKITPVKQEIVKQDLTPTGSIKLPTDSDISIKVEKRGGKFAVDYFDVDEKSNLVPKTEIFDTADEADSFVKIRKDEGKFYGPSMTRRGVDSDVAKKIASKSSYGQYRKLGTGKEK